MIHGNTDGLRNSLLEELEALYQSDAELLRHEMISQPLMEAMARLTGRMNRELSVYVARDGMVMDVSVGSHDRVDLPGLRVRRGQRRLTGIRCLHTHPDGTPLLSSVDLRTLRRMRFDAMVALGCRDGAVEGMQIGLLTGIGEDGDYTLALRGPYRPKDVPHEALLGEILLNEAAIAASDRVAETDKGERAILIGVDTDGQGEESLEELARLADTAGAAVLYKECQRRPAPDAGTYLGRGKISELALVRQALDANLCIADDELTASQAREIADLLGCRVIDRTQLILDIFAGRATTHEGKLQVELAQYKYLLPRLGGKGVALSRLGGGIGTRGPGESQLETDRRHIRRRLHELEEQAAQLEERRQLTRKSRTRSQIPVIALVGYTNAGKSTLLNALTQADAFAEDKLFATLDPLTRKLALPDGTQALAVDTVGFIHKLPHDLVDAFRSTLEEALYADLLVHVVDASSPQALAQYQVAEQVLASLGTTGKPRMVAFNKMDSASGHFIPDVPWVDISARLGSGLDALKQQMEKSLDLGLKAHEFIIPYALGRLTGEIRSAGKVLEEEYLENGIRIRAMLTPDRIAILESKLKEE